MVARFIGLKLFMALAERGEAGYAEMIEHQARMGDVLRERLWQPGGGLSTQRRYRLSALHATGLVPDAFLSSCRERQIAWMSDARVGGVHALRACITSFKTTEAEIDWVVDQMNRIVSEMHELEEDCVSGNGLKGGCSQ